MLTRIKSLSKRYVETFVEKRTDYRIFTTSGKKERKKKGQIVERMGVLTYAQSLKWDFETI